MNFFLSLTHHSALSSEYTMKANEVVRVNRFPVGAMLSDPNIAKMIFADGDEAIRAQLGFLDCDVAPSDPELVMVIGFGKEKIKKHSFLVGGKSRDVAVSLSNLEGLCRGIDTSSHVAKRLSQVQMCTSDGVFLNRLEKEWVKRSWF